MTTWQLFEESVALSKLRLEYFEEGLCAQVMHIGPYATEPATIERMREFMKENCLLKCDQHSFAVLWHIGHFSFSIF